MFEYSDQCSVREVYVWEGDYGREELLYHWVLKKLVFWRPNYIDISQEQDQKDHILAYQELQDLLPKGNCHLAWMHLIEKFALRLTPLLLALGKKFENTILNSAFNDLNDWITKHEDIHNHIDVIKLMPCMADE